MNVRISDEERRRRMVRRHHLAHTADGALDVVRGVVALHSSDPLTPHLGARARLPTYEPADLETELCDGRRLWRLHAMRRTLFVVPVEDAPAVVAGATRDVARRERRRLAGMLEAEMAADRVEAWIDAATDAVVGALGDAERSTTELGDLVPALQQEITLGSGRWAQRSKVSSRLLFLLAMDGLIVRTRPAGTWRSSQYRWARARSWFGADVVDRVEHADEDEARVELARRYLARHGPATATDVRWWTGWAKGVTTRTLAAVDTATVELDGDEPGLVLADDLEVDGPSSMPVAALLPSLDPSAMGWKERAWYLADHQSALYDTNGNSGPTVWIDGRVVGGWGQRPDGKVLYELLDGVADAARDAIDAEVEALARWLDGTVVAPRFPTPLHGRLSA